MIVADAMRMPLADESVGLIITSPPYNVGLNYDGYEDVMDQDDFREFNRRWLVEAFRVARESTRAYVLVGDKMMTWFPTLAESVGWTYAQMLVWCKPNIVGKGKISGDWTRMHEPVVLLRKGKKTPMLKGPQGVRTFSWLKETVPQGNFNGGRIHPAQLPVSLCAKWIYRTPGEPVLDPFAGSGSVLVAAKELGRPFIGFDIVPSVVARARDRLEDTQSPLFAMPHEEQLALWEASNA